MTRRAVLPAGPLTHVGGDEHVRAPKTGSQHLTSHCRKAGSDKKERQSGQGEYCLVIGD